MEKPRTRRALLKPEKVIRIVAPNGFEIEVYLNPSGEIVVREVLNEHHWCVPAPIGPNGESGILVRNRLEVE